MKDQRSPTPPDDELDAARARIAALEGEATRHRVATAGGKSMAWRRFGKGPPLVLIHGGHGSWLHWVHNIEPLAQRHTLWVPDLPGYGDSDLVESGDVEPIVESVVHSLDALEGRGSIVDLCGFSFGGLVASRVASDRGGVRRLAVIGTAGHGLKSRYRLGKVGDVEVKTKLARALNAYLDPIRERRAAALAKPEYLREVLFEGSKRARRVAVETMARVRDAVKLTYA